MMALRGNSGNGEKGEKGGGGRVEGAGRRMGGEVGVERSSRKSEMWLSCLSCLYHE